MARVPGSESDYHPQPELVQSLLRALEVDLAVARSPTAALVAILQTPKGRVELR